MADPNLKINQQTCFDHYSDPSPGHWWTGDGGMRFYCVPVTPALPKAVTTATQRIEEFLDRYEPAHDDVIHEMYYSPGTAPRSRMVLTASDIRTLLRDYNTAIALLHDVQTGIDQARAILRENIESRPTEPLYTAAVDAAIADQYAVDAEVDRLILRKDPETWRAPKHRRIRHRSW